MATYNPRGSGAYDDSDPFGGGGADDSGGGGAYNPPNDQPSPTTYPAPSSPLPSPAPSPAPAPSNNPWWYDSIANAYRQYLGREGSHAEIFSHMGNGSLNSQQSLSWALGHIMNSPEAAAYKNKQAATPPTAPTPTPTPTPNPAPTPPPAPPNPAYQPPSAYNPTQVFSDPATQPFMDLLNQRISALEQPHQNPDLGPLQEYLRKYFEQLQGPAYSPAQMDLMQTQALDPMERQRSAAKEQALQRLAAHGIAPSSGIVEKAMQAIDNEFNQIRTKTQSGFAAKAIDLDRINHQQAASVGQLLANLDQQDFSFNEGRANQGLGFAQITPELARQRMLDANAILSGSNISPTSLLNSSMGFQSLGMQQDAQTQQFWMSLAGMIPGLLNLFKGNGK